MDQKLGIPGEVRAYHGSLFRRRLFLFQCVSVAVTFGASFVLAMVTGPATRGMQLCESVITYRGEPSKPFGRCAASASDARFAPLPN